EVEINVVFIYLLMVKILKRERAREIPYQTENGTLNNRRMMSRAYGLYLFLLTFKIGTEANRRN
ncbi:hypothetical protein, partial [Peribacillus frigoritolerans]